MSPLESFNPRSLLLLMLIALTTAAVQGQTYSYDEAGRLTTAVYPDGTGVRYTYDASGNLTNVSALTVPTAPATPTVTASNAAAAELSWTAAAGATNGYIVQRRSADTDI